MPAADHNLLRATCAYLRRRYATNVPALRQLADTTFAAATQDTVTLTALSAEGGSQSGEITCPRGLLLDAIETVLAELDTTAPRASNAAVMVMR